MNFQIRTQAVPRPGTLTTLLGDSRTWQICPSTRKSSPAACTTPRKMCQLCISHYSCARPHPGTPPFRQVAWDPVTWSWAQGPRDRERLSPHRAQFKMFRAHAQISGQRPLHVKGRKNEECGRLPPGPWSLMGHSQKRLLEL